MRLVTSGVLLLLALAPSAASAQSIAAKGGLTFATLQVDPSDGLGSLTALPGAHGGGAFTFRNGLKLDVQVDAQVSLRRTKFEGDVTDMLTLLEIPALVRYQAFRHQGFVIRVIGGGSFGYVLKARESVPNAGSFDIREALNSVNAEAVVGGSVQWKDRWTFDARFLFGLTDTYAEPIEGLTVRHRAMQFSAAYRIR